MSTAGTGIELKVEHSAGAKIVGAILHLLHLDAVNERLSKVEQLVVSLDGAQTTHPWAGPHVIACAPGKHALSVWFRGWGPAAKDAGEAFSAADLTIDVREGELTTVVYAIHSNPLNPPELRLEAPPSP